MPIRTIWRLGLGGSAGILVGLSFPPFGLWWLLPLGVAGLSLAARQTAGFRIGLVFGIGFLALLLPWLRVVGSDAWIALSLMEACFYGALGWALLRVSKLPAWPLWQACLWVVIEAVRGVLPWGGFNWGRLAFATIEAPVAPAVTLVGAAGVSFLVALSGTLLAWAVLNGPRVSSLSRSLQGL